MVVYRESRRRRLTLLLVIVTSLALITLDQRGSGIVGSARSLAQDVLAPVQNLADDVINPVTNFVDSLGRADELQAENDRLRRELTRLQGDQAQVAADAERLRELEGLVDLPQVSDYDGVIAHVVDGPTGNFVRTLQIDKGRDAGIKKDMPVVVADGLVGRVISVSRTRSIILRLDDPQFGVGVQLLLKDQLGPTGIAGGKRASTLLDLSLLDSSAQLVKGEIAVTRGSASSMFPKGITVGTVVRARGSGTATSQESQLKPVVDLDRLDLVKVLKYQPGSTP